jgi:hypothetical protein
VPGTKAPLATLTHAPHVPAGAPSEVHDGCQDPSLGWWHYLLPVESPLEHVPRDLAAGAGDFFRERDVFRTHCHAVLGIATDSFWQSAVGTSEKAYQGIEIGGVRQESYRAISDSHIGSAWVE